MLSLRDSHCCKLTFHILDAREGGKVREETQQQAKHVVAITML